MWCALSSKSPQSKNFPTHTPLLLHMTIVLNNCVTLQFYTGATHIFFEDNNLNITQVQRYCVNLMTFSHGLVNMVIVILSQPLS